MNANPYFENMTKTAEAYEAARHALKERKQEIIRTHGWESPEMTTWQEEEKALADPFTRGEWKALRAWTYNKNDELLVEDFNWDGETEDFISTLRKAGIQQFITVDRSTALMENIHAYIAAGCTLEGPATVEKESWHGTEMLLGLRFSIN